VWGCGLDSYGLEDGQVVDHHQHGNEILRHLQGREFHNRLGDYQLLKKKSVPLGESGNYNKRIYHHAVN
jgi:hypothetical protein